MALHDVSFRWPVGFNFREDLLDERVTRRIGLATFVAPDGQQAARFEDPNGLREEPLNIEPVQCLSDSDQVDRAWLNS